MHPIPARARRPSGRPPRLGPRAAVLAWLGVAAVSGAALGAAGTGAAAQPGRDFAVTTGHVVSMTPVDDLDCGGLARKLAEIDATGYRGHRPRPADRRDRLLFDYEKQVSRHYYSRCPAAAPPGTGDGFRIRDAFRKGFQARQGD